jgi:hypothetical protein
MAESWKMQTKEEEKKPPSLRRHYPVQVLRVLSQPYPIPHLQEKVQHPGNLKNRFSAGDTNISKSVIRSL